MGKIDFLGVYKDRIKQIEIDSKKAINEKKWSELAKLRAEKEKLEKYIEELT